MWESFSAWLRKYESIAIWLEGIALVAIFILDWKQRKDQRKDREEQHKETLAQLNVSQAQADALINSERAWVVAELVPICRQFGSWWHRPAGNGWAALSEEEVLRGDHLKQNLKFTNMGRTPAHILRYHIAYSREADATGTEILMIETPKRPEIQFDRLLAGNESIEVTEIDVSQYISDSIVKIGDAKATGLLSGWLEYLHVFSDTEVVNVPFVYLYDPSFGQLKRVPLTPKKNENQPPN